MLIPLSEMVNKHKLQLTGVVHIGAHECEELGDYLLQGIPIEKILWFEALDELVTKSQRKIPNAKIYQAVLSDQDNKVHDFIVTNNYMSSSLLELKDHLVEHPYVQEIRRDSLTTITFKTLVQKNKLDLKGLNFLNLDIQGTELHVLKGMAEIIYNFDYIYTEVNIKELYEGCTLLPDLDKYLEQHGFKRVDISMTSHGWGDALYIKSK